MTRHQGNLLTPKDSPRFSFRATRSRAKTETAFSDVVMRLGSSFSVEEKDLWEISTQDSRADRARLLMEKDWMASQ